MATAIEAPIFRDLNPDDADQETTEIESVCVNCFENGSTRLLLTKIPFYKEVILMSFNCDHCGFANNEIQPGGEISEKGCRVKLTVNTIKDLNRRVVKSDYSSVRIEELDFEIPAKTQKGEVTTVEGIIDRAVRGLEQDQVLRRIQHPDAAQKIDEFIGELNQLKLMEKPFTLQLEDISGNCFIENPKAPHTDPDSTIQYFVRSTEENHVLGIFSQSELNDDSAMSSKASESKSLLKPIEEGSWPLEELHGEVLQFSTMCHKCGSPCDTNMKVTSIPHFKDVVIMATVCDRCGYKTNEVKSGSGIELQGVRIEVHIKCKEDISRDVLKSETCDLRIPDLDCEVGCSALGGRFTTVEGILVAMKDQLAENSAMFHDSEDMEVKQQMKAFLSELGSIIEGNREITLVLDDPAGNSYVQSLCDDDKLDAGLTITRYDRTFDQNEELGLNDMKTENY